MDMPTIFILVSQRLKGKGMPWSRLVLTLQHKVNPKKTSSIEDAPAEFTMMVVGCEPEIGHCAAAIEFKMRNSQTILFV